MRPGQVPAPRTGSVELSALIFGFQRKYGSF